MLRFKILLVAALGLLNILESVALLQEDYVRVLTKPDGTKNIIMMDFERIVVMEVNNWGTVSDCTFERRNELAMKMVEFEASVMTGGYEVQYIRQEVDVAWYGRACIKLIRDKERTNNRKTPTSANLLDKKILAKTLPGTKFCTSTASRYNSQMKWDVSPADACCQELANCPSSLQSLHYKYGFLNHFTYRLYSCNCVDKFRSCLSKLTRAGDEEAVEVERMFFDVLDMKCSEKLTYTDCKKYDKWFNRCENGTTFNLLTVNYGERVGDFPLKFEYFDEE